jgi:hypothetical protein
LDVALRGVGQIRGILALLGHLSGELRTQLHVSGNLTVALRGLDDNQIKAMLRESGHGGWVPYETLSRAETEADICRLIQKAGGVEAFRPAGSDSKSN